MVAAFAAACSFFPTQSSSPSPMANASKSHGGGSESFGSHTFKSNPSSSSRGIHVKANAQGTPKINGTSTGLKIETQKSKVNGSPSSVPRTFYNQLPDWSMLLAAVTSVFLAAEKKWTLLDWKPRRPDMLFDAFDLGKVMQDSLVFRQKFSIRSYEIGADQTASLETLMNLLQDAALNHVKNIRLLGDGFGATPEMNRRDLIWVVMKMQVSIEQYPTWGDIIEVETWVASSRKNGMRRDWHVRDCQTGHTILRGTSVWVMMNKHTRRLSKLPDEVRAEIVPHFVDREIVMDEDSRKLLKLNDNTADYVRSGLTPRWGDLDANQHVNNVKYVGWVLESVPVSIMESLELASMTLEYRKECDRESVLQSQTAVSTDVSPESRLECGHLLRLESGPEILRGRTQWRPKRAHGGLRTLKLNAIYGIN